MVEDDDPFGAFGDSDTDSDHDGDDKERVAQAQALIQQANQKSKDASDFEAQKYDNSMTDAAATEDSAITSIDLSHVEPYSPPPCWDTPLYVSPNVRLVSSLPFGGGRGYLATKTLKPGTLILVEQAIMTWPEEQLGQPLNLSSVGRLLRHENANNIIACLEYFHPTKKVVDSSFESESPEQVEEMIVMLKKKYGDQLLDQLVQAAQNDSITNRDGSRLTRDDIIRIFLALQYNGLESGLFCYVAMINHKCRPNCVKFLPGSGETDSSQSPSNYSEVRTTRCVKEGESLTISYIPKMLKSHASRRNHLWEQHRFDIGADLEPDLRRMEVINNKLPPSSKEHVNKDSISSRIERSLEEMDLLFQSAKYSLSDTTSSSLLPDAGASLEQAKALEVSSLELYTQSKQLLSNDNHLLLIPCLILHLDSCDLILRRDAKSQCLTHSQRCKLLGREVLTAFRLLYLQKAYWGADHFDVARTHLDLSQAIEELLAKSPGELYVLDTHRPDLKDFREWSVMEYQSRKEHERIKALYPRDALDHIRGQEGDT